MLPRLRILRVLFPLTLFPLRLFVRLLPAKVVPSSDVAVSVIEGVEPLCTGVGAESCLRMLRAERKGTVEFSRRDGARTVEGSPEDVLCEKDWKEWLRCDGMGWADGMLSDRPSATIPMAS